MRKIIWCRNAIYSRILSVLHLLVTHEIISYFMPLSNKYNTLIFFNQFYIIYTNTDASEFHCFYEEKLMCNIQNIKLFAQAICTFLLYCIFFFFLISSFFMPPHQKIGGILFYCCPSVHLHKLNVKT